MFLAEQIGFCRLLLQCQLTEWPQQSTHRTVQPFTLNSPMLSLWPMSTSVTVTLGIQTHKAYNHLRFTSVKRKYFWIPILWLHLWVNVPIYCWIPRYGHATVCLSIHILKNAWVLHSLGLIKLLWTFILRSSAAEVLQGFPGQKVQAATALSGD